MGLLEDVLAVTKKPSTPTPLVLLKHQLVGLLSFDIQKVSTPKMLASSHFDWSGSRPNTLHPFARSNWQVINPIIPKPLTAIVSPKVGFNNLIPCKPTAAITVNAASSRLTSSGIRAHKFSETVTNSAWNPFETTLSPTLKEEGLF